MNLGPALRLLSVVTCVLGVLYAWVADLPDYRWLFTAVLVALGLYVASFVVAEFPRRTP